VRQRIVNLVADRPDGITRGELLDLVYADDPNGGPDNPNTISVLIKHANEELAAQGFRIEPAWLGPGARYRLVRVAPSIKRIPNPEFPQQRDLPPDSSGE
jgi:hypothetical protein